MQWAGNCWSICLGVAESTEKRRGDTWTISALSCIQLKLDLQQSVSQEKWLAVTRLCFVWGRPKSCSFPCGLCLYPWEQDLALWVVLSTDAADDTCSEEGENANSLQGGNLQIHKEPSGCAAVSPLELLFPWYTRCCKICFLQGKQLFLPLQYPVLWWTDLRLVPHCMGHTWQGPLAQPFSQLMRIAHLLQLPNKENTRWFFLKLETSLLTMLLIFNTEWLMHNSSSWSTWCHIIILSVFCFSASFCFSKKKSEYIYFHFPLIILFLIPMFLCYNSWFREHKAAG